MSPEPLPVAVVGVGHLGKIHAKIYHEMPGVQLVAVVDTALEPNMAAIGATSIVCVRAERSVMGTATSFSSFCTGLERASTNAARPTSVIE